MASHLRTSKLQASKSMQTPSNFIVIQTSTILFQQIDTDKELRLEALKN